MHNSPKAVPQIMLVPQKVTASCPLRTVISSSGPPHLSEWDSTNKFLVRKGPFLKVVVLLTSS